MKIMLIDDLEYSWKDLNYLIDNEAKIEAMTPGLLACLKFARAMRLHQVYWVTWTLGLGVLLGDTLIKLIHWSSKALWPWPETVWWFSFCIIVPSALLTWNQRRQYLQHFADVEKYYEELEEEGDGQ